MRELFKALPIGVGVPLLIGAASVGPEDAASNISKWARHFGLHHIPEWMVDKGADNKVIIGVVLLAALYAALVWVIVPMARRLRGQVCANRKMISLIGMVACAVGFLGFAIAYLWPHPLVDHNDSLAGKVDHAPTPPEGATTTDTRPSVPCKSFYSTREKEELIDGIESLRRFADETARIVNEKVGNVYGSSTISVPSAKHNTKLQIKSDRESIDKTIRNIQTLLEIAQIRRTQGVDHIFSGKSYSEEVNYIVDIQSYHNALDGIIQHTQPPVATFSKGQTATKENTPSSIVGMILEGALSELDSLRDSTNPLIEWVSKIHQRATEVRNCPALK